MLLWATCLIFPCLQFLNYRIWVTHNKTFCIVLQGLNELNYTKYLEQYIVAWSCLTLWDSIDCTVPSFSVYGDVPGKNTGVGFHALLQGIFPTQGSNPGLLYCRQILYHLSHQGNPRTLEWVTYPFSRGSSQPRKRTWVSWIAGRFFTSWATREAMCASAVQSCLTLCDPMDSSPQAPLFIGFSRQEYWSGVPFPSPTREATHSIYYVISCCYYVECSVVSDSFATSCTIACQLLCSWDSSGRNTGAICHFFSPGDLPNPGMEPMFPVSPALQADSLPTVPSEKPQYYSAKLMLPLLCSPSMLPIPVPPKAYTPGDTGVALCTPRLKRFSLISLKRSIYSSSL